MGRKWNSFSSFIGLRSKMYHTPTMLAQSSFFGCYYSFSWLEVTVGGHQTTWLGRNQPEFLPQSGFSHALWAPCWLVLHGGVASGCQRPSLGQEAAGPGGLSYRGDLTLPCPPWLALGPANTKCPQCACWGMLLSGTWDSKRCWGPSAPSVSRSSQRHSAPQSNTWSLAESSPISIFPGIYRSHIFYINI